MQRAPHRSGSRSPRSTARPATGCANSSLTRRPVTSSRPTRRPAATRSAKGELEALVVDAVRRHLQANSTAPNPILETDRELIERHLLRATLGMTAITLHLRQEMADAVASGPQELPAAGSAAAGLS